MISPSMGKELVLPSAIDDEFLMRAPEPPGLQPPHVISVTGCYVQAIKLQNILGQVLSASYCDGVEKPSDSETQGGGLFADSR